MKTSFRILQLILLMAFMYGEDNVSITIVGIVDVTVNGNETKCTSLTRLIFDDKWIAKNVKDIWTSAKDYTGTYKLDEVKVSMEFRLNKNELAYEVLLCRNSNNEKYVVLKDESKIKTIPADELLTFTGKISAIKLSTKKNDSVDSVIP